MRVNDILTFAVIAVFIFCNTACEKLPGEGGKSSIKGKVYAVDYQNDTDIIIDTFPALDEDVYLIYGSSGQSDDDVKTNYDGIFQFDYLREGNYQLFFYAKDWKKQSSDKPIVVDVSVGKSETKNVGNIYLYLAKDGTASISGTVTVKDIRADLTEKGLFPGRDEDVFLQRIGETTYFENTKTGLNGEFQFLRLYPGTYCVFAYSEDIVHDTEELLPVRDTIVIEEYNQHITDVDFVVLR